MRWLRPLASRSSLLVLVFVTRNKLLLAGYAAMLHHAAFLVVVSQCTDKTRGPRSSEPLSAASLFGLDRVLVTAAFRSYTASPSMYFFYFDGLASLDPTHQLQFSDLKQRICCFVEHSTESDLGFWKRVGTVRAGTPSQTRTRSCRKLHCEVGQSYSMCQ